MIGLKTKGRHLCGLTWTCTIVHKLSFSRLLVPRQYLGPFHIVLSSLWCLQVTVERSKAVAWTKFGLYSSVTVVQILNGKHYSHALDAHQISLQVLLT